MGSSPVAGGYNHLFITTTDSAGRVRTFEGGPENELGSWESWLWGFGDVQAGSEEGNSRPGAHRALVHDSGEASCAKINGQFETMIASSSRIDIIR